VELSRHAVQDIHENFPLAIGSHDHPPNVQVAISQTHEAMMCNGVIVYAFRR
jgi:hypothetical protein